jgi:hypothetical protein
MRPVFQRLNELGLTADLETNAFEFAIDYRSSQSKSHSSRHRNCVPCGSTKDSREMKQQHTDGISHIIFSIGVVYAVH